MLRSVTLLSVVALACLSVSGCSTEEETPDTRAGDIRANDTWKNGLELTGTVRIIGPSVVEIEPGATIKCTKGAQILIGGVLRKAPGAKAKISCSDWQGILVAQGGKLELEDFEIENAVVGVETTPGALDSTVKKSSFSNTLKPFLVGKDSKLLLEDVKAVTPRQVADNVLSIADVHGTLVAKKLDYDTGPSEGVTVREGGSAEIEDSFIHGVGGQDMIATRNAKSLKVSYTKVSGAHCGPHIEGVDSFTIDHLVSEDNTYGITIYGAGAGPNLVKDSNIQGDAAWLDIQGEHGPITFENVYTSGGEPLVKDTTPPTINKASGPVAGAGPR
jgi:hypothetical protein